MSVPVIERPGIPWGRVVFLLLVAVAGLAYVKWWPYYGKAFVAYSEQNIGSPILVDASGAIPAASWQAAIDYAIVYGASIWKAMVLGLVLGTGLQVLLPAAWIANALGRLGMRSTLLGSLLALPCMMCTCCAAPVAAGMRQQQASIGSVVAWWLANPLLNPATLVFMGFVLGWDWAGLRLLFGMLMTLGIAWLVERFAQPLDAEGLANLPQASRLAQSQASWWRRWIRELLSLTLRIVPEYLVLVLLLGAARAWLFPVAAVDDSLLWIVAMALAGTLFVIPTAAEIPIAQTLLALGGGSGPAMALLMTLPALSLPSLVMLGRVFDRRTLVLMALGVALAGVVAGILAKWGGLQVVAGA